MDNKIKAGLKSTEFYIAIIGAIIPVINKTFGLELDPGTIMSIAGVCVSYIASRAHVKASEAKR